MAKPIAHSFILDELLDSRLGSLVRVRPMFGSHAVYVEKEIVFILRHQEDGETESDNGLWVVSLIEHVDALRADFPNLRLIEMFQHGEEPGVPTWNNLPETDPEFERDALLLCELVSRRDPRIGRNPEFRKPRAEPAQASKKVSKKKRGVKKSSAKKSKSKK